MDSELEESKSRDGCNDQTKTGQPGPESGRATEKEGLE